MPKKIIAVDFDGTLCENEYPFIGEARQFTIEKLKREIERGNKVILWTCRCGSYLEDAVSWCEEQGIIFDAVNENLPEMVEKFGHDSRKIFATHYWDDKASRVYKTDLAQKCSHQKHNYDYCKLHHMCVGCRKKDSFTMQGKVYCAECTERNKEYAKNQIENRKEASKRYYLKKSKEVAEKRLCGRCFKNKPVEGLKICQKCRDRVKELYNRKRIDYSYTNLCTRCHKNEKFGNFKLCEDCYNKSLKSLEIGRKKIDFKNHKWQKKNDSTFKRGKANE